LHDGFRNRDTRAAGAIAVLHRMITRYPIISRLEFPDHFVDWPTLVDAGFVEAPVREYDPSPVLGGCSQRSHRPDRRRKIRVRRYLQHHKTVTESPHNR
jgi:hypothetical protein